VPVELAGLDAGDALPEAAPVVPVLVAGGHGGHEEAHRADRPADQHARPSASEKNVLLEIKAFFLRKEPC